MLRGVLHLNHVSIFGRKANKLRRRGLLLPAQAPRLANGNRRLLRADVTAKQPTQDALGVHRLEEHRIALRRLAQLAEQEFDSVDGSHWVENAAQDVHFL